MDLISSIIRYEPKTRAFTYYESDKAAEKDTGRKGRSKVIQSAPVIKSAFRDKVTADAPPP